MTMSGYCPSEKAFTGVIGETKLLLQVSSSFEDFSKLFPDPNFFYTVGGLHAKSERHP